MTWFSFFDFLIKEYLKTVILSFAHFHNQAEVKFHHIEEIKNRVFLNIAHNNLVFFDILIEEYEECILFAIIFCHELLRAFSHS
jgi:hypothetical protein